MTPHKVCFLATQTATASAGRRCGTLVVPPRLHSPATTSRCSKAALWPMRSYATHHQTSSSSKSSPVSRRRAVTPFNDDGRVPWSDLSLGEKTGRAAQQTFNLGMVLVGVALTGGVVYFLYTEVFSPDSKVSAFNRAVNRIRSDHRCTAVLGDGDSISAYGQETWNKWQRARPIASTMQADAQGVDHIVMNFNVEGSRAKGEAYMHMVKPRGRDEFVYRYFYVDVPGHDRIYLERADGYDHTGEGKRSTLFGIKWS